MIQISVKSTDIRNQSGNAKASGKPYSLNFQTVWMHTYDRNGNPNPYPEKTEIILDKAQDGAALFYPIGEYTLDPRSVYITRTGDIALSPKLVALAKKPQAAAV